VDTPIGAQMKVLLRSTSILILGPGNRRTDVAVSLDIPEGVVRAQDIVVVAECLDDFLRTCFVKGNILIVAVVIGEAEGGPYV
jgi:hypothetical protein